MKKDVVLTEDEVNSILSRCLEIKSEIDFSLSQKDFKRFSELSTEFVSLRKKLSKYEKYLKKNKC